MSRYKSTVAGTDVEYDPATVRRDDLLKLFSGELSNGASADLLDHVRIVTQKSEFSSQNSVVRIQTADFSILGLAFCLLPSHF